MVPVDEVDRRRSDEFLVTGEWLTRRRFAAGELIFREGEPGERAYILESGECEVFRSDGAAGQAGHAGHAGHGEVSLRRIGAGEVIGEIALLTQSGRTASVRALTAMTLLEVTREALAHELPAGSWTRQIIDTLAARFLSIDRGKT